jgi:ectoine hydroxylase-related dioxygenase (phytanoyl-CoA dioxygenase family)
VYAPNRLDLQALQHALDEDGYVVFDPEIEERTIDAAIADTSGHFRTEGRVEGAIRRARRALGGRRRTLSHRDPARVQDAWTISENVKAIARAPRVLDVLRELYGREPLPFQTLNFKFGSQQRPHSDAWHFNSDPSGYMCGVWVALEDIGDDSGPLVYYPGSHKLAEVAREDVSHPGEEAGAAYEEYVRSLIEREGLEARFGTLRKGEALLWSSNLLHGGSPRRNPDQTRWTQVTHYFFEGCRYWKPLVSGEQGRHYWDPAWVS